MSSMLAFPQLNEAATTRYQGPSYNYSSVQNDRSYASNKSVGGLYGGGLPTPPTTSDMSSTSIANGNNAYQAHYSYIPEYKHPRPSSLDLRPSVPQPSNANQGHSFDERVRTSDYGHSRSGSAQVQKEDQLASHLQIPETINNSGGSLPEFAAEMTCLFWFESSATIEYAASLPKDIMPDRGLNPDAIPSIGFRKWVTTILSTTQVGTNVIILALMFIYRLKKISGGVSGKKGSEFRLITIALMLGNKFLDDNTYTNKTWAEVSGMSVNEIHIMEVEFLSNVRYQLFASKEQFAEWETKLGRLGSFYEKASRFDSSKATSPITPITQTIPHKLPSPSTGSQYSNGHYPRLPNPMQAVPHMPQHSPAPYVPSTEVLASRKRSLDTSNDLPIAKRLHSLAGVTRVSPDAFTPTTVMTPDSTGPTPLLEPAARYPQLPMPSLQQNGHRNGLNLTPLSLPAPRAMSSVYPVNNGTPMSVTSTTTGLSGFPMLPLPGSVSSSSRAPSHPNSAHTSPTNIYGTPTRAGLSPSYFLMNRSSPYRPVRQVDKLLIPPPSGTMANTVRPIDYQQIHYQPLSKNTNQIRTGPMPCLQPNTWQTYVNTPSQQTHRPY